MPKTAEFTHETYSEAYLGHLKKTIAHVPVYSVVGLAKAMGVPASNHALRAYCYLLSHCVRGSWITNAEQYGSLLQFLSEAPCVQEHVYTLDDGTLATDGELFDAEKLPDELKHGVTPYDQLAYFVSVVSTIYKQVGVMFPEIAPQARPGTAKRAIDELIEAGAIERIHKGDRGTASLYLFIPLVFDSSQTGMCRTWGIPPI